MRRIGRLKIPTGLNISSNTGLVLTMNLPPHTLATPLTRLRWVLDRAFALTCA